MKLAKISFNNKNLTMTGVSTDHIWKHINNTGNFYELDLLKKILEKNLPGTYIDCGANIGNHSLFFSEFCNCDGVISFEPSRELLPILSENMKQTSKKNMIISSATGNENGCSKLKFNGWKNSGMSKVSEDGDEIFIRTIDSVIPSDMNVSVIKMDVENYELDTIKGAYRTIERNHPLLTAECHDDKRFFEIREYLKDIHNYKFNDGPFCKTPTYIFT